jgi:hypothetical protein
VIEIVNRTTGEVLDADSVPGLAAIAALHDEQIARMSERVEELLDGDAGPPGGSQGPVVWHQLSEYESQRIWRSLAEWVGWLRSRYPLAHQVPLCWWRHPELVEELTALWLAWREAYVEKGAALSAGADWHSRWLPDLLRRIGVGGWNLACEGEHRPLVDSLYDPREVDDQGGFAEFTSVANRQTAAPTPQGVRSVDNDTMQRAVIAGEARQLGDLPGAPIAYDGGFWMSFGGGWVSVDSEDTIAFLTDADERLQQAREAVRETESS